MTQERVEAGNGDKCLLLSVKPQYANLIVDGLKTIELRRKFSLDVPFGTRCFIYSSSPVQMVIGECKIKKIKKQKLEELWRDCAVRAMISWADFNKYFERLEEGCSVELFGYTKYKTPLKLQEVSYAISRPPQSYRYLPQDELSVSL